MRRYVFGRNRIFTGRVLNVTEFDPFPHNSTEVPPPPLQAGEWARWRGDIWEVVNEIPAPRTRVPSSIELRQLKQVLRKHRLMGSVKTAINALSRDEREKLEIDLDHMNTVDRSKAFDLLAGAINETMIDTLFIEGQNL
jgi:hypothetical protein